ncbi:MAG: secondary thiamine-phosphate synthase enzyme YjbQ, partial [Chloroflexota bacterium]
MWSQTLPIETSRKVEFIDLTPLLEGTVRRSGIWRGLAHVILKHTSASISVQEFEPNLLDDFESFLKRFASDDPEVPRFWHNQLWRRPDRPPDESLNADAHIKSLFMGNSRVIPVEGGRPDLGTWQRIILVEMDGPREREVTIMVQGDTALEGFKAYWGEKSQVITAAMAPYLEKQWMGDALEASRYLMRGGKRIRGVLALLICEALGGDMDKALDAAVAVEMVHASSLAKD